jgi:hypothetical protein
LSRDDGDAWTERPELRPGSGRGGNAKSAKNNNESDRITRIAARARENFAGLRVQYKSVDAASPARAATASQDGTEQRRHCRHDLGNADVSVRRVGSFNFSLRLRDVSAGGCGIELVEPYDAEDHLIARFKGLDPLGARVCWTSGPVAGIAFDRAIHPAVFDNLLGRLLAA